LAAISLREKEQEMEEHRQQLRLEKAKRSCMWLSTSDWDILLAEDKTSTAAYPRGSVLMKEGSHNHFICEINSGT
jgi:hypothetical protein